MTFEDYYSFNHKPWATVVKGRSPEFKVHSSEGTANTSIAQHAPRYECAKYEFVNNRWEKRWEHLKGDCPRCGANMRSNPQNPWTWKGHETPDTQHEKVVDKVYVCIDCFKELNRI